MRSPKLIFAIALAVLLLLPGCALVNSLVEYPTPTPKPQLALRPTFTPTVAPTAAPPTAEPVPTEPPVNEIAAAAPVTETVAVPTPEPPTATPEPPTPTPEPPTPTPEPRPEVVVSNPRVNVRSGPGPDFPVLGQVLQGQRLEIVGRDQAGEWWQVCCFEGQTGWLASEVVTAEGPLETVALAADLPAATPQPSATEAAAAGDFRFDLTEEISYPFNQDYLRVGVKVNDQADNPLGGYYLHVVNESTGQQWLSPATSAGPWRGTAPSPDFADYRQANLIFDTRAKSTLAGNSFALWLVDGAGRAVAPTVRYTQDDDEFRWLYIVWTRQ